MNSHTVAPGCRSVFLIGNGAWNVGVCPHVLITGYREVEWSGIARDLVRQAQHQGEEWQSVVLAPGESRSEGQDWNPKNSTGSDFLSGTHETGQQLSELVVDVMNRRALGIIHDRYSVNGRTLVVVFTAPTSDDAMGTLALLLRYGPSVGVHVALVTRHPVGGRLQRAAGADGIEGFRVVNAPRQTVVEK